ncbi:MAG: hypothetical protein GY943_35615 [Chloroflexi bacterium]|nr:hypothetical protein [Chloroflexota bacterium]
MNEQDKQTQDVLDQLSVLNLTPFESPRPAAQAMADLRQRIDAEQKSSVVQRLRDFLFLPARRGMATAVTLLLVFTIAFSFPTVRAAASDFLGLFRVQKFEGISISPEQFMLLQQVAEQGLSPGDVTFDGEPNVFAANSLDEAIAATGFEQARTLTQLGAPEGVVVTEGGNGRLDIDIDGLRAIFAAANVDPTLIPETLDNARVEIGVFPGIEQNWADGTLLVQMASPEVSYPEDIDQIALGEAVLQLLGMSPLEAARLSRQIDWTSTLLLPIPTDAATFEEVTVEGVSGLALIGMDGQHTALIWQTNGVMNMLLSEGNTADLLALTNTLR